MLHEETHLYRNPEDDFHSGGLVPLDVAVGFMAQGIYVEEIEFDVDHFNS
jgi:hypothetical protein